MLEKIAIKMWMNASLTHVYMAPAKMELMTTHVNVQKGMKEKIVNKTSMIASLTHVYMEHA